MQPRHLAALALAALALAVAYLAWRGVWRAVGYDQDLNVGYAAAEAWLQGLNPYDPAALRALLEARGQAEAAFASSLDWRLNVYFPPTLLIFLPLVGAPYLAAHLILLVVNLAATAFIAWAVMRWLGWEPTATRSLFLIAFWLALTPVHGTIAAGQTGLLAMAGLMAGFLLERAGRRRAAGLLHGLATVAKVQIGLPYLAYLVWKRRTTEALTAALVIAGFTLASVGRLALAEVEWLDSWFANLATLSGTGGINDPSLANPDRLALVNLQYALSAFIDNRVVVEVATAAAVTVTGAGLMFLVRGRRPPNELLALAGVGVLGLLIAYHRYYDAVVLILAIAWGLAALWTPRRRIGVVVLLLVASFLVPVQTALVAAEGAGLVPGWVSDSLAWDGVLLATHVWALLLLAGVIVFAAWREAGDADGIPVVAPAAWQPAAGGSAGAFAGRAPFLEPDEAVKAVEGDPVAARPPR